MANQIITGQKVTFFDSIDFNRKYYEGSYYATYNSLINGELHPDTILGTDIGGAIFFSPPANSYYAHITHGGKIYTLGSAVITETPTSLANVKKNPDVDLEQPIDDSWTNGAFMTSGLVGNEKLPAYFTAAPWDKTITVNTTNVTVTDLLKVINKLCAEVAALKHGSSKIPVTPIAPQPREFYEPTEPQPLILQTEVTGVIMEYRVYHSVLSSTTPIASTSAPSEWSREIPKAKEPAKYTVEWRATAEEGYVLTGTTTGSVTSTIKENVPTEYAVPAVLQAVSGTAAVYKDGENITLAIEKTAAQHCTMYYSLTEDGTYTTTIPTAVNAGSYTVYWKAEPETGYSFEPGKPSTGSLAGITITKKQISSITVPSGKILTYTGSAQDLINKGSISSLTTSKYQFKYKLIDDTEYSTNIPRGTNAGPYGVGWNVALTDTNNYEFTSSVMTSGGFTVTIAQANSSFTLSESIVSVESGKSTEVTITPTNCKSFSVSTSDSTKATASVSGNTITITAGSNTGSVTLTVSGTGKDSNYKVPSNKTITVSVTEPAEEFYWFLGNGDTIGTWDDDNIQFVPGSIDVTKLTKQSGCPWSTDDSWAADGSLNCTIFFPYKYKGQIKTFANASKTAPVAINAFSNYVIDGVTYIASYANISPSTIIYLEIDI